MYITQDIAERIKITIKDKKLTTKNMLEELNLGINTISEFSKGKHLSCISLARIADYLDCSVDYLLGRTDNPQSHKMPVQRKPFSGVRPATIAAYGHETMGIDEKE